MNHQFTYLDKIIKKAAQLHVQHIDTSEPYAIDELYRIEAPYDPNNPLNTLMENDDFTFEERIILLLAIAPYFYPQVLDLFFAKNPDFDRICTEFGGVTDGNHRGVIPTGETAMFLLTGRDVERRKIISRFFLQEHKFYKQNILYLETVPDTQPMLSGKLIPHPDFIQQLTYGKVIPPKLSIHFPARQVHTNLEWKDLILAPDTQKQLQDIQNWLHYGEELKKHPKLARRSALGYKALFYGPPGTGKTLTASLLGKSTGRPVFLIDLSLLVSKYIGETEKNLSNIFKKAEDKNWILFFDEADALFSKRTENASSNDRYANQEVAYLLQRIETYDGLVILVTNLKQNLDKAFLRRFQSMVHFATPKHQERFKLWSMCIPDDLPLDNSIDINELARNYDLSAAQISNIVQSSFIYALSNRECNISRDNLLASLRKEYQKENRIFEQRF
ncbi:ATP-binding protein [Aquimarina longa]|uniref:ATP-binding protein n=1 Tax=Aquimarina longa TaxID=1080221 RepID=UPI0007866D77|nr:ATP-binding protein [Aquimarina longa]